MHNAKKLYEKKGLGNATIEEITEAADVSRSTFFSHFASIDALSTEIAGIAIQDILETHKKSGKRGIEGIIVLINKLIDDTCPYPHLTAELLMNGMLKSTNQSPFYDFERLITSELISEGVGEEGYSYSEQVSLILGAYFGIVFQKLIKREDFDNPDEIKKTINKLIYNIIGGK